MADSDTGSRSHARPRAASGPREAAAELRVTRVSALNQRDLTGLVTYLLAKYPDTFPPMLDEALSEAGPASGRDGPRTGTDAGAGPAPGPDMASGT